MSLDSILTHFRKILPAKVLDSLAKKTGVVKRSTSKLSGKDMATLLVQAVNAPVELSLDSFCRLLNKNSGLSIRTQSLWERIVSAPTVDFMRGIYEKVLEISNEISKKHCLNTSCRLFKKYSQVLIEDSTVITLNKKLSTFFKGTGGSASKSSLKIHLIFDSASNLIRKLKIYHGSVPDLSMAYESLKLLDKGSLLIRDLGFFVLDTFKKIDEMGSFFISRLHFSAGVYLSTEDKISIDLIKHLKKNSKTFHMGLFLSI
jgi:hypothetical protein